MKRFTYFSLAVLALTSIAAISASAQTDYKFGKVTRAELERTDYPAMVDGADAVALEDLTDMLIIADSCFDAKFDAFARFYYSHRKVIRKIKILNSDGLKYANIKIPHRHARHPRTFDSSTEGIRGYSYTLKDGKISRSKLKVTDIKLRMTDDSTAQAEFTIPDVEVGSIIEYEYTEYATSTYPRDIDVIMQKEFPILNSRCMVSFKLGGYHENRFVNVFKTHKSGSHPMTVTDGEYEKSCEAAMTVMYPEYVYSSKFAPEDPFAMRDLRRYRASKSYVRVECWGVFYDAENLPAIDADTRQEDIAGVRITMTDPYDKETNTNDHEQ